MRIAVIVALAGLVVALPFVFKPARKAESWQEGDPFLVVVTPHNEAIRQEFSEGFAAWHLQHYGRPARIDWRAIGGTTEIMRYLASEYTASARRYFQEQGEQWRAGAGDAMLARRRPEGEAEARLWDGFRASDSAAEITSRMDVFFGGGVYDHSKAEQQGLTVAAWGGEGVPEGIFSDSEGRELIPESMNGEVWRGKAFYGNVLSAFGISYNYDRLRDLGMEGEPGSWEELADPRFFGQLGLADPTKSGSVAKAFEMIVHTCCARSVAEAGFGREQISEFERVLGEAGWRGGELPEGVPQGYQEAIERGWVEGVKLLQRIGANARYFTDTASKVPVDISTGAVAAGIAIDFYSRFQEESSQLPDGRAVMGYVTPIGGSSVSADPISMLRGAPRREIAQRFIEYVLGEEGQKLWNYAPGSEGGPQRFALRRLPIRRDFYPSGDPVINARAMAHREMLSDKLWEPQTDAYHLSSAFLYEARWTGRHFGIQRDLVRAMCMDSGEELVRAWGAILRCRSVERQAEAVRVMQQLPDKPVPLTWESAVGEYGRVERMEYLREWTAFFREQYRKAERMALSKGRGSNAG